MRITEEPITGYAHCAMQITEGRLAYAMDGTPEGLERCPGHRQEPVDAIRRTTAWTYADGGDETGSPQSLMVEKSSDQIVWADPSQAPCKFCGEQRELTDQIRPVYSRLSEHGPDQVFEIRRRERLRVEAAQSTATSAERQARALERIADGAASAELEQLRAQVTELSALVERLQNGGAEKPRRRGTT